jgi:HSP20 family molecular chaperone IbpA
MFRGGEEGVSDPKRAIRVVALRQPYVAFETRHWQPPLNVYETGRGVVLLVDLAGVNPADLHVHVTPTLIAVHGVRQLTAPPDLRRVHRMEIGAGRFELEVPLGAPIDPERAEGRYRDGLLEIGLPFADNPPQRMVVIRIEGGPR